MVNIERVTALRDYLIAHPEELDMDSWGMHTPCGTTACVAGRTVLMFGKDQGIIPVWNDKEMVYAKHDDKQVYIEEAANALLGLEGHVGLSLYFGAAATVIPKLDIIIGMAPYELLQ